MGVSVGCRERRGETWWMDGQQTYPREELRILAALAHGGLVVLISAWPSRNQQMDPCPAGTPLCWRVRVVAMRGLGRVAYSLVCRAWMAWRMS